MPEHSANLIEGGHAMSGNASNTDIGEEDVQISPEEIIALKEALKKDSLLKENICAQMAIDLVLGHQEFDGQAHESPEAERKSVEDLAFAVGQSAASYAIALDEAIRTPGSEWPLRMQASEFLEVIGEVQQRLSASNGSTET
jgi:hypothetical protein